MSVRLWLAGFAVALPLLLTPAGELYAEDAAESPPVDYQRQIRPLLSDRCYTCHGPDGSERKADLRLDLREHAVDFAIVPGSADDSEVALRVASDDPDLRMPPPDSNRQPLSAEELELLRRWIDEGANYETHWAYVTPVEPEAVDSAGEPLESIDQFIERRLSAAGLSPSAPADPRTLVRRLSFDLTGLPSSPEMVEAFADAPSDEAYAQLVDQLLASPRFGERMAIYWLDVVRYADTNGIHGDNHRDIWAYRDYVINAFNDNKPFDQFTIEQLAGDLMAEPTFDSRVASGYNRLLMTTREGGAQPREYTAKYAADRVRNVSSVWLGATMGCSECHDHKFDPYTMRDFYSMAAFFADVQETAVGQQATTMLTTPEQEAQLAEIHQQLAPLRQTLNTQTLELDAALVRWEEAVQSQVIQWQVLPVDSATGEGDTAFEVLEDGSIRASAAGPAKETYTVQLTAPAAPVSALRLEVLDDDTLPARGPGRATNGNFVLSELTVSVDGEATPLAEATATHSQNSYPVAAIIDGNAGTGWAILPRTGASSTAIIRLANDLDVAAAKQLTVTLSFQYGGRHSIGRFRISATDAEDPTESAVPDEIRAILAIEPDQRTAEQQSQVATHYRSIAPELTDTREAIANLEAQEKTINDAQVATLVSTAGNPRTIRILPRGNWLDDSGEVVMPAVPEFLPPLEAKEGRRLTRLDLAQWLVDPNNPLTARVMVNRLWMLMFGRGLVSTPDDFGLQGASPSHAELLDWLALEFINNGWDVKHMLRLMVTSQTYRQSSRPTEQMLAADAANELLARQGRFRLDAEMIRDNALSVSGLLVEQLGGPSVKPYQPTGYWVHLNFPRRTWQHDTGDAQYRRGLYTYWCRTFLHPSLRAFDAPTREECAVQRTQANTPLQALVLLNDPTYVESARVYAEQILQVGGDTFDDRLGYAFRHALQRAPRDAEGTVLQTLYDKHLAEYQAQLGEASALLQVGLADVPEGIDAAELAAWTSVTRVLFNLQETIMRY